MMHKRISWIAMACLLTACGSKSPGMSKEDAAKALSEQAEQQAIAEKVAIRQAVMYAYYDEAMGQICCFYLAADDKAKGYNQNTLLIALPYEAMLAASESSTVENITSRLQVDKFMMSSNIFTGMEGGNAFLSAISCQRNPSYV